MPHDPSKLAAIYLGGVVGALIRVGLAQAASVGPGQWPWPTFVVNMVGAFLLGYFFALFRDRPEETLRHPFLATGLCGTLTTFSTMQLEMFDLVDDGYVGLAIAYAGATVALGYFFVRAGIALERGRGEVAAASEANAAPQEEQ
ncbi:MAG: fluoride efflux transporter CrcB [Solirubrobacterales bacterium]